jgi:hypothetical protein
MTGLVPAIHVFFNGSPQGVDARDIGERSDAVLRTAIGERSDAVFRTAMGGHDDEKPWRISR